MREQIFFETNIQDMKKQLFLFFSLLGCFSLSAQSKKPNILYILVDQWRAQSIGYAGDQVVKTPHLDQLEKESLNLRKTVSGMPVCSPHRASLITGQYPLTHGVFMNDVLLDSNSTTIAKTYKQAGYQTAYIGKWHMDGHGRSSYIPVSRRQGFDYWKALECTHDYNHSEYYSGDSPVKKTWESYDAIAQSEDVVKYLKAQSKFSQPFMLFISIGSPHDPYQTAPEKYRNMYENVEIKLRDNVPLENREKAIKDARGYYAHMTAIDDCVGQMWQALKDQGLDENTILVFSSDHGDLLGSHGAWNKQQPYEESIRVPFLLHYPKVFGKKGKKLDVLLNTPDIMPTLLGLTRMKVPKTVEGRDFSSILTGKKKDDVSYTLISCVQPFGQWPRAKGGREYRGLVSNRYTYVKDLQGPWLLFDNKNDPFQLTNLVNQTKVREVQSQMEKALQSELKKRKDEFKSGLSYVKQWNYLIDETETVPYQKVNYQGIPIKDLSTGYPQNTK